MEFKKGFVWGAATASYQVEGAYQKDGKGLNIWDLYTNEKGYIYNNHNGNISCDHYNRISEDIALMKQIGLKAYRFSISFSRIFPENIDSINQKGIDFYNKLINELIENGIEPYVTLYHWDLPLYLHNKGGFLNEECVEWFGKYAKIVTENFSDRVKNFITINEPQCFIGMGYKSGEHAPFYKLPDRQVCLAIHNTLKASGMMVRNLRKYAKQKLNIGIAECGSFYYPETESEEDIEAARKKFFGLNKDNYVFDFALWLDTLVKGKYPEEYFNNFKDILPVITDDDMKLISEPLDFIGVNVYYADMVKSDDNNNPEIVAYPVGYPATNFRWNISPKCIYWATKFIYERYKVPLYITENGMSCHDFICIDGKVHDSYRIDFIARYLTEIKHSVDNGADVRGYFHWSLMDNFEWQNGYKERFGLIYVDYSTKQRTLKDSAYWYKNIIEKNGEDLI